MKYAHINKDNKLLGWYDDEIHQTIPTLNVKVSDEVWKEAININANFYDKETKTFIVKDFRSLEEIKNQKIDEINNLCEQKIINGFTSVALISKHYYKSTLEDQINLQSAVLSALDVKIKCSVDKKVWSYKLHNKEQVKAVLKDFEMFKDNLLLKADAFKNVVNNSLDAKDLENINF